MKRCMLFAFVSTPLTTLAIQTGIPNVNDIAIKCNMRFALKRSHLQYERTTTEKSHIFIARENFNE